MSLDLHPRGCSSHSTRGESCDSGCSAGKLLLQRRATAGALGWDGWGGSPPLCFAIAQRTATRGEPGMWEEPLAPAIGGPREPGRAPRILTRAELVESEGLS